LISAILAKPPTSAQKSSNRLISSDFFDHNLELLTSFLGVLRNIPEELAGEPTNNHHGVFDLVTDMGRHLAHRNQSFGFQEPFLHLLTFPQIPEKTHSAHLLVTFKYQARRKLGWDVFPRLTHPDNLILDQPSRAAICRTVNLFLDLSGQAGRIEFIHRKFSDNFCFAVTQDPFGPFVIPKFYSQLFKL
jgi:hypothetical protein